MSTTTSHAFLTLPTFEIEQMDCGMKRMEKGLTINLKHSTIRFICVLSLLKSTTDRGCHNWPHIRNMNCQSVRRRFWSVGKTNQCFTNRMNSKTDSRLRQTFFFNLQSTNCHPRCDAGNPQNPQAERRPLTGGDVVFQRFLCEGGGLQCGIKSTWPHNN